MRGSRVKSLRKWYRGWFESWWKHNKEPGMSRNKAYKYFWRRHKKAYNKGELVSE